MYALLLIIGIALTDVAVYSMLLSQTSPASVKYLLSYFLRLKLLPTRLHPLVQGLLRLPQLLSQSFPTQANATIISPLPTELQFSPLCVI